MPQKARVALRRARPPNWSRDMGDASGTSMNMTLHGDEYGDFPARARKARNFLRQRPSSPQPQRSARRRVADAVMLTGPAGDGRADRLGRFSSTRLPWREVADDLLSHSVEQRQRTRNHATDPVEVRHARPDDLGVVVEVADEVRRLLQVRRDPVQQAADPEEVERQAAGEHADGNDGQDYQTPHTTSPSRAPGRGRDDARDPQ